MPHATYKQLNPHIEENKPGTALVRAISGTQKYRKDIKVSKKLKVSNAQRSFEQFRKTQTTELGARCPWRAKKGNPFGFFNIYSVGTTFIIQL